MNRINLFFTWLLLALPLSVTQASPPAAGSWYLLETPEGPQEVREVGTIQDHWLENRQGQIVSGSRSRSNPLTFSSSMTTPSLTSNSLPQVNQMSEVPLLVLLVGFNNIDIQYAEQDYAQRFFGTDQSVRSYYKEALLGKVDLKPAKETFGTADGIISVQLNEDHPNTGKGSLGKWVDQALQKADSWISFAQFDGNSDGKVTPDELAVVVVFAGYERSIIQQEPNVWAQTLRNRPGVRLDGVQVGAYAAVAERHGSTANSHMVTRGIICHELGHLLFDLPDLYLASGSAGFGTWGIMGTGSWGESTGGHRGDAPVDFSAWSKTQMGLLQPKALNAPGQIDYRLTKDAPKVLWTDPYRHLQYYLLKYREQDGIDSALRDSGLLISYVDQGHFELNSAGKRLIRSETNPRGGLYGDAWTSYTSLDSVVHASLQQSIAHPVFNLTDIELDLSSHGLKLEAQAPVLSKTSYGFNEIPWQPAADSSAQSVIMKIKSGPLDYAEGVDVGVTSPGQIEVGLASSLSDAQNASFIATAQMEASRTGWIRLRFDEPIALSASTDYFVRVTPSQGASLMIDAGPKNGVFYEGFSQSPHDFGMRLLVETDASHNQPPRFGKTTIVMEAGVPFELNTDSLNISDVDDDVINIRIKAHELIQSKVEGRNTLLTIEDDLEDDQVIYVILNDGYHRVESKIIVTRNSNGSAFENTGYKVSGGGSFSGSMLLALLSLFWVGFYPARREAFRP